MSHHRLCTDVMKLITSNHDVTIIDGVEEFIVKFDGPYGTLYEGGAWKIHVRVPSNYPFEGPMVCFLNKIFHPNIMETSGFVYLDLMNHLWTPVYDLSNIFEIFLPELLTYPNPEEAVNLEAASLYLNERDQFEYMVNMYIRRYALKEPGYNGHVVNGIRDDLSSLSDY